jgi:uncharacterized membrane protein
MTNLAVRFLLWFSAIGCGLMAGVYLAFSTFIMTALARVAQVHGVSVMNSINATILQSLFMPLFFGTTVASGALAIIGLLRRSEPGATMMLVSGLIYIAGMFLCTVFFNVPLNNALAAVDPDTVDQAGGAAGSVWARYLKEWTMWNHVRVISSAASSALYIWAIAVR